MIWSHGGTITPGQYCCTSLVHYESLAMSHNIDVVMNHTALSGYLIWRFLDSKRHGILYYSLTTDWMDVLAWYPFTFTLPLKITPRLYRIRMSVQFTRHWYLSGGKSIISLFSPSKSLLMMKPNWHWMDYRNRDLFDGPNQAVCRACVQFIYVEP